MTKKPSRSDCKTSWNRWATMWFRWSAMVIARSRCAGARFPTSLSGHRDAGTGRAGRRPADRGGSRDAGHHSDRPRSSEPDRPGRRGWRDLLPPQAGDQSELARSHTGCRRAGSRAQSPSRGHRPAQIDSARAEADRARQGNPDVAPAAQRKRGLPACCSGRARIGASRWRSSPSRSSRPTSCSRRPTRPRPPPSRPLRRHLEMPHGE